MTFTDEILQWLLDNRTPRVAAFSSPEDLCEEGNACDSENCPEHSDFDSWEGFWNDENRSK